MYFGVLITVLLAGTAAVNAACVNPPIPANGYLSFTTNGNLTLFEEFTKITQACNVGYTPSGSSADLFCYNGTWLGSGITCTIVDCKTSAAISNGNVTLDSGVTTYNATATLACKSGYTINGSSSIRCQSNGIWTTGGTCQKISCGDPAAPANGNITQKTGTLFGDVATVVCNVGYNSDVTSSNTIQCSANGSWSPTIRCLIVNCGSPPSPANGSVSLDTGNSTFQSTATQKCNYGYNAGNVTKKTITCQSTGKWETGISCALKDCGSPPAPANGTVALLSGGTLFLSKATQYCYAGYKAVGSSADIFCLDYGWSTDLTGIVCQIKDCGQPTLIPNGKITPDVPSATFYQSTASVTCNEGYNITGNASIQCLSTGLWSSPGTCKTIDCGSPPAPANGSVKLDTNSSVYQSTATQTCNVNYTPAYAVTNTIVCLGSGYWQTGITCVPN